MQLRTLSENELEKPNIGYFTNTFNYRDYFKPHVKFKRVSFRRGKKRVTEFYGELVYLESDRDIKVLVPLSETTNGNRDCWEPKNGDFFMANIPIKFSNPRKLTYRNLVLCDLEELEF